MKMRPIDPAVSLDLVRSIFSYEPETGVFIRKIAQGPAAPAGAVAGRPNGTGYQQVKINYRDYLLHRLAWFYVYGKWPECEIDHIDGNKSNNAISNLREANTFQNKQNVPRKKGYHFVRRTGKYQVRLSVEGKRVCFGSYDTESEARIAYLAAHAAVHGQFSPYHQADSQVVSALKRSRDRRFSGGGVASPGTEHNFASLLRSKLLRLRVRDPYER